MVANVPQRLESKRRRDQRQADIVQTMLDQGLLKT
jgi:ribosomal protein L32